MLVCLKWNHKKSTQIINKGRNWFLVDNMKRPLYALLPYIQKSSTFQHIQLEESVNTIINKIVNLQRYEILLVVSNKIVVRFTSHSTLIIDEAPSRCSQRLPPSRLSKVMQITFMIARKFIYPTKS